MAQPRTGELTAARMSYGDRSFEELVWPSPTRSDLDIYEMAAILTPRGGTDSWRSDHLRSMPVTSPAAAKRLLVLCYAHRLPIQIIEMVGHGRSAVVRRDAEFRGDGASSARRMLASAARQLDAGTSWLDELREPVRAAVGLWRASLLCNGLVRGPNATFALRVLTIARAAALRAAADTLGVEVRLTRNMDALRLQIDPDAAEGLLDRLLVGSRLARCR